MGGFNQTLRNKGESSFSDSLLRTESELKPWLQIKGDPRSGKVAMPSSPAPSRWELAHSHRQKTEISVTAADLNRIGSKTRTRDYFVGEFSDKAFSQMKPGSLV